VNASPWNPVLGRTLLELAAVFEAHYSGESVPLVRARLFEQVSEVEAAAVIGPRLRSALPLEMFAVVESPGAGMGTVERLFAIAFDRARPVLRDSILEVLDLCESRLAA
jgi:hypothetical protein